MDDRQFSTGSIEAPDPYDKHLDHLGFYRKYTARDASCLFRVISEQMYDAQIYHTDVRDICVRYMGMNRSAYEDATNGTGATFDEYLNKMSMPRTHGTLTELTALAYRFQRNVFLFEALSMGCWYVYEKEFKDSFLVFYTPPKHFDTVFTKSHMESVAFCQSLTYEILYSTVFRLPDVIYAVERMLHDPPEGTHVSRIQVSPYDETQETLTLSDGRYFILDHADETECILKNYLFCHFHNKRFEKMIALDDFSTLNEDDPDAWALSKHLISSSLPRRNVSCVRQLLDENIKPFSYKVAKALDTHIYRNIEFDAWTEARKHARFRQWSQGDTLQVGVKCLVANVGETEKLSICHIQEMCPHKNSCVVFVESLGETRTVPTSDIETLPSVAWMVSNQSGRYRSNKKRNRNKWSSAELHKFDDHVGDKCLNNIDEHASLDIRYFTKTLHIPQQYHDYIANPLYTSNRFSKNDESGGGGGGGNNQQPNNNNNNKNNGHAKKTNQIQGQGGEKLMKPDNGKNATPKRSNNAAGETKSGKPDLLNVEFEPHIHYGNQSSMGYIDTTSTVTYTQMDRADMDAGGSYACQNQFIPLQSMIRNKELLRSNYPANLSAQPSIHPDGTDLQRNDNATIRFFYNLGHEYMRYMHYRFPSKAVNAMFQGILTDSFPTRPNRYSGGFYDNFHDIGELANDFGRSVSIPAGRDQHTNRPIESQNQYRRTFIANTVNIPKKGGRYNRYDYKGKRQYSDSDPAFKNQHQAYSNKPTSESVPLAEPTARASECDPSAMPPTPQLYSYHDGGDPIYGVPVGGYGMYPHSNDNFAPYPMPVQGGMVFSEPLNMESDLTQTYPYYNPYQAYYYPTPMPPTVPMGQLQGTWYPQSIIPIQSTVPVPIPSSGSSLSAAPPPITTPTYTNYIVPDPETSTFTPSNEP